MGFLERAEAWRKEFLRQATLDGAARLTGWSSAVLAVVLWIDYAFSLPQLARGVFLSIGAAAFVAGIYSLLLRPRLRFDWGTVFDAAAREFPELREYLRSAWDLKQSAPGRHTSEELRAAHLERADRLVRALPDRRVFVWRPTRSARRGAFAALLAGVSLPWLGPGASWERILAPWRDVPLERFVSVSPEDADVDWGGDVEIKAGWTPSSPAARDSRDLKLWIKGASGWRASPWDRVGGEEASFNIAELTAPLQYRLSWRDLSSRVYRLTPVMAPELENLRVKVQGPGASSVLTMDSAVPLSVLRGSWIAITGQPNQPLAKAFLKVSSLPVPVPMKTLGSGEQAAVLQVLEDATLQFDLETKDGRKNPHPVSYGLKARPDEPPTIELLSPQGPVAASPADSLPIAYSAKDDGGLARISLIVRAAGKPEKEIVLRTFAENRLDFAGEYSWDLAGLSQGKVEFQLKALDNAAKPQAGFSAKGLLEVVDFDSAHADMESEWGRSEGELADLASREAKVRKLLALAPSGQESRARLEDELAGLPEAWKQAAEHFSDFSRAMRNDAYANPGLAAESGALSEALRKAQSRELSEALKSSRAGDWAAAEKKHERLSNLLKNASRLLSEGKKIQGMEDFYTEAGRMSQTGSALESALESLAGSGGAPSQEGIEKLNAALARLQKQMQAFQKAVEALPKASAREEKSRPVYSVPLKGARENADALSKALAAGDYAAAARIARRLAEQLEKIEKTIGQAAAEAAASAGGQASSEAQKAAALWSEVIEDQTKVLEESQRLDEKRLAKVLAAQKELLGELAKRQGVLVSSAAALGARFEPGILSGMKEVQGQFEARAAPRADEGLREISARLRGEGALRPERRESYEWFAAAEDEIRRDLEEGPPPPPSVPGPDSSAAAGRQGEVRGKTGTLQRQLESISDQAVTLPEGTLEKLAGAQTEQKAAEESLRAGDSAEAIRREQNALSLLEQGSEQFGQGEEEMKTFESGYGEPFGQPASGLRGVKTGPDGSGTGFVPLPRSSEYRPPREIREELEKSLQEKRPASYDGLIKEYFKRIAQ